MCLHGHTVQRLMTLTLPLQEFIEAGWVEYIWWTGPSLPLPELM